MASVIISLVTLAWSYTVQYRQNKENSFNIFISLIYFVSVSLLIIARILSFQMFAYYLGPGKFRYAMFAVGCHALIMALLHFIFSDSLGMLMK